MPLIKRSSQIGVSLVEALVAMAVMGFGMLAVVGVQGTLRFNGDVSKQRGEAMRLAEHELESLRSFTTVASGGATDAEFDSIASTTSPATHSPTSTNTTFTLSRNVKLSSDKLTKMVEVTVDWVDRTGQPRQVAMHDVIARVDPMLSGFVKAQKPLTPIGRRSMRHPTIPGRAHDLSDGTSIFKPVESGTVAWVFNNSTGAITHVCSVSESSKSNSLTASGCSLLPIAAQLVAGEIRFNLRGAAKNLGSESAFKPVATADVAWVVNHASKSLVRICPVSAGSTTASLTAGDVTNGCTGAAMPVTPFDPSDATYSLIASDSEQPHWPTLPLEVKRDPAVMPNGIDATTGITCYSNVALSKYAHAISTTAQSVVEYFCIVTPISTTGWGARLHIVPAAYSDGGTAKWSTGTVAGTYRVCRYTQASTAYTTNEDHPAVYSVESSTCGTFCRPVVGNLISQNYLIIDGTKLCPTDVPADPASGNLVNSNTLQHQP